MKNISALGLFSICEMRDPRSPRQRYKSGFIQLGGLRLFYKKEARNLIHRPDYILFTSSYPSASRLFRIAWGRKAISFYTDYNCICTNGHTYLTSEHFSAKALAQFFEQLLEAYTGNTFLSEVISYPSRLFFEDRHQGGRSHDYYGLDYEILRKDMSLLIGQTAACSLMDIILNMKSLCQRQRVFALSHGDLHDINFSYDWKFWDLDNAGFNPLLADLAISFWFYTKQRYALIKYNPWFIVNSCAYPERVDISRYQEACQIFLGNFLLPALAFIETRYPDYSCRNDFLFYYLCRALFVDNIMQYSAEDRMKTYMSMMAVDEWRKLGDIGRLHEAASSIFMPE